MFSIKARSLCGLIALAGAVSASGAAWSQTIVIGASGPSARSYPAGKSLAAGSRIVLRAGDTLTVLDNRGTRTLRGPLTTSAAASATTANASFAALVATQNRRRARTGAIRGTGESARPSNLWQVNVTAAGTVCVADRAAVQLWRPDMQRAATLTVAPETGPAANVVFPLGQNAVAWPAGAPIAEGKGYVFSGAGLTKPVRVRFAMLGAPASNPAATYAALDAKGCNAQKQLLVGALKTAE